MSSSVDVRGTTPFRRTHPKRTGPSPHPDPSSHSKRGLAPISLLQDGHGTPPPSPSLAPSASLRSARPCDRRTRVLSIEWCHDPKERIDARRVFSRIDEKLRCAGFVPLSSDGGRERPVGTSAICDGCPSIDEGRSCDGSGVYRCPPEYGSDLSLMRDTIELLFELPWLTTYCARLDSYDVERSCAAQAVADG